MRPLALTDKRTIEALKSAIDNARGQAALIRDALANDRRAPYDAKEDDAAEWDLDADLIHDLLVQSGWAR
jgi:hypothetical protein